MDKSLNGFAAIRVCTRVPFVIINLKTMLEISQLAVRMGVVA